MFSTEPRIGYLPDTDRERHRKEEQRLGFTETILPPSDQRRRRFYPGAHCFLWVGDQTYFRTARCTRAFENPDGKNGR